LTFKNIEQLQLKSQMMEKLCLTLIILVTVGLKNSFY